MPNLPCTNHRPTAAAHRNALSQFDRQNLLLRHIVPDIRPKNPVQGRPHLPRHCETPGRIRKNLTCPNSPTGQAPRTMNRCCTCHKRLPKLLLPIMFPLPFPVNFKFLIFMRIRELREVFFQPYKPPHLSDIF